MRFFVTGGSVAVLLALALFSGASGAAAGASPSQSCVEIPGNPVLNSTEPFYLGGAPAQFAGYATEFNGVSVIASGSGYVAWLSGVLSNVSGIFRATSTNGVGWSIGSSPVLSPGGSGSWDSVIYSPSVVFNGTGYMMYFTGSTGTPQSRAIGVAFSSDGVRWTPYSSNPVVSGGPTWYDAYYARYPSVLYEGGVYKMWYTGHNLLNSSTLAVTVDYATSKDGVSWAKSPSNPVLREQILGSSGFGANSSFAEHPSVVRADGAYVMFYDNGSSVKYALGPNETSWTVRGTALTPGSSGRWDNATTMFPAAVENSGGQSVWFFGSERTNPSYLTPVVGIGMAGCSLNVFTFSQTLTETQTVTFTRYSTSTSISTSIGTSTQRVTVVSNPGAPFLEVATAFVIGLLVALAGSILMIAVRLRSKAPTAPAA